MIIMVDLDETLLNSQGEVGNYTKMILEQLRPQHKLVFNSARSLTASQKIADLLKPDWQILNAGSTIYDSNNHLIYENPIAIPEVNYIVKYLKSKQIFNILIESGNGFLSDNLTFISTHGYVKYANLDNYKYPAYKIVYHDNDTNSGTYLAKKFNFDFTTYVNSNIHKISKTNKGQGLDSFKAITKTTEPIIAFGDDLGDIPMLLKADVAVKMANSNNALNDYPFLTCPDNNSDGVAKFLLSYLKKKEGI